MKIAKKKVRQDAKTIGIINRESRSADMGVEEVLDSLETETTKLSVGHEVMALICNYVIDDPKFGLYNDEVWYLDYQQQVKVLEYIRKHYNDDLEHYN